MPILITTGSVQSDADICNRLTVDAPVSGIHIGPGVHVAIPVDWQARCVAGEVIPGCNFHKIDIAPNAVVSMIATDKANANVRIPANVVGANATAVANLISRLNAGTVIPN